MKRRRRTPSGPVLFLIFLVGMGLVFTPTILQVLSQQEHPEVLHAQVPLPTNTPERVRMAPGGIPMELLNAPQNRLRGAPTPTPLPQSFTFQGTIEKIDNGAVAISGKIFGLRSDYQVAKRSSEGYLAIYPGLAKPGMSVEVSGVDTEIQQIFVLSVN